jgi:Arc/MetJ family transcription regulator
MKTTIEISDDLMKKAKALAARRHITLREVIERGIRTTLKEEQREEKFSLPNRSVEGKGFQAGFEDASWADIRDAVYKGQGA